jgi:cell division septum initiation protein DivIVA
MQSASLSGVTTARKQFDGIEQVAYLWNGDLHQKSAELEAQLADFTTRTIPAAIQPLSKTLEGWKTKFNASMSNTAKQYQSLSQMLDLNLTDVEKSAKTFDVISVPMNCESLAAQLQDMVDTYERQLNVALPGLTQKLQIDIMRAKMTANSTLALSLSNSEEW